MRACSIVSQVPALVLDCNSHIDFNADAEAKKQ